MALEQSLAQFAEKETSEAFSLQNSKLLKVELSAATVQAKLGSMVAHQGDVKFEHAGSGGMSRFVKKAMTGEGTDLMKVSGSGEVFLAHMAQDVQILRLEGEAITANGANVLAFEDGIDWDIKRVEGASGMLGGGLYNMHLQGTGYVAIMSDGPPMLIQIAGEQTYADPQAAITWSAGVSTSVKADVNMKTLIGKGSGESIKMAFGGQGWVLVQPSEGRPVYPAGGGGGGLASMLNG